MSPAWQGPGWAMAGALALLCSTVAWASFPRMVEVPVDGQRQWVALGVTSLSGGGATGMKPDEFTSPLEQKQRDDL